MFVSMMLRLRDIHVKVFTIFIIEIYKIMGCAPVLSVVRVGLGGPSMLALADA
jgi:hypothetical protein